MLSVHQLCLVLLDQWHLWTKLSVILWQSAVQSTFFNPVNLISLVVSKTSYYMEWIICYTCTYIKCKRKFMSMFLWHSINYVLFIQTIFLFYSFHFPSKKYISYDEAHKNISLIFVNSHTSQGNIRPNVPGIVEVGGIQIKSTPSPLPEVSRKWDLNR